jgi:hypothetical protein
MKVDNISFSGNFLFQRQSNSTYKNFKINNIKIQHNNNHNVFKNTYYRHSGYILYIQDF